MKMRKFIVSAAAAAMVMGSTVAQAAPVAIDNARSGSSLTGEQIAGENSSHIWLGLLGLAALVFVLFAINDNDGEDDLPHSP
jgi:hypothetical protein